MRNFCARLLRIHTLQVLEERAMIILISSCQMQPVRLQQP